MEIKTTVVELKVRLRVQTPTHVEERLIVNYAELALEDTLKKQSIRYGSEKAPMALVSLESVTQLGSEVQA